MIINMTKLSKTDNKRFSGLSRVAGFVRASVEAARATDRLAKLTRQHISVAAHALVPRTGHSVEKESAPADLPSRSGSESRAEGNSPRIESGEDLHAAAAMSAIHKFAVNVKALDAMVRVVHRAGVGKTADQNRRANADISREDSNRENRSLAIDSAVESRGRSFRMIEQSLSGIETLTRIQDGGRATSTGQKSKLSWGDPAGRAERALGIAGRLAIGSEKSPGEPGARFERGNFDSVIASAGKYMSVSRARGWRRPTGSMVAPASFSRSEFAEPMRGVYGQESRSTPGAITINSTPTVVINPGEAAGDVERQVIGALRAHREELFDQFKRESIRRERAQF